MTDLLTPEAITAKLQAQGVDTTLDVSADPRELKTEKPQHVVPDKKEAVEERPEEKEEVKAEEPELEEEYEASSIEQEAEAKGWKPDGPKSAEEFLRAEPLYEEIKSRGKEIKELKATMDAMKAYMDKQQKLGYEKALSDLEAMKNKAIAAGNVDEVRDVEQKIEAHKNDDPAIESVKNAFVERNASWIHDPSYEAQQMRVFAEQRDVELTKFNLPPEEHLKQIEADIKKKFANRFDSPEASSVEEVSPVQSVESDAAPARSKRKTKHTFQDLSPEQKQCARQFERKGVMKIDDYIKSLVEMGEL